MLSIKQFGMQDWQLENSSLSKREYVA
jgi:hypothetical protein